MVSVTGLQKKPETESRGVFDSPKVVRRKLSNSFGGEPAFVDGANLMAVEFGLYGQSD
jgi:hypothetical protein